MVLEHDIKALCNITGPMTNEETIAFYCSHEWLFTWISVTILFSRETAGFLINWRSWRFCPDKNGWINIKRQCSWYGNKWQHCVNNCKFLTADCCWNIQGLCWAWKSEQLCRSITCCAALWFLLCIFARLYFLFATANDLAQAFSDAEVKKMMTSFITCV